MPAKDFVEKSKWLKGPEFLKQEDDKWLKKENHEENVDPDSAEVKEVKVNSATVKEERSSLLQRLMRFSSWHAAKVAVALCLKYRRRLRERVKARQTSPNSEARKNSNGTHDIKSTFMEITAEDLKEVEAEIIKCVQIKAFASELRCLKGIQLKLTYGSRESDKEKRQR